VYVAVVGSDEAHMWEEAGTDEIDEMGHENWDKSWTSNNEYSLWFQNNGYKDDVERVLEELMCDSPSHNNFDTFLQ
jgi:hypothetical protein